ncbi:hypothetical protein BC834DRAFT_965498 [Gloeopeniophorella convolvens]|nr:hypothetical protein BC834DRAFT_965498 [Gloeopeniophorella convolvens]
MGSRTPALRVQITQIDYSLDTPDVLDNSTLPKAPVLRIYGASSVGKKCCLHIHQVYPYFFVEYLGKMSPDSVSRYIAKLTHSLNYAIAVSLKRDPQAPKSRFVRGIVLVKGIHFYGFSSSYSPFLKVHLADPALLTRAVAIMQSGSVMGTPFQTFENHLSYILQFLSDFGLYGCGWIELEDVWQRGIDEGDTPSVFKKSVHYRQSRMELEVDTVAAVIMNRHNISPRHLHHKLVIPQPPTPPEPLVLGVRELWDDERRRRAAAGLPPSPDLPQDPSANSRGRGGDWVAEARWWDEIRQRIERERDEEPVMKESGWEKWIMTTFESIEALWEDGYRTWKPGRDTQERNPYASSNGSSSQETKISRHKNVVDVDEALLSSQDLTTLEEQGKEGWDANQGPDGDDGLTDDEQLDATDERNLDEYSGRATPQSSRGRSSGSTTPVPANESLVTPRKRRRSPSLDSEKTPRPTVTPSTNYKTQSKRPVVPHGRARTLPTTSHPTYRQWTQAERQAIQRDQAQFKYSLEAASRQLFQSPSARPAEGSLPLASLGSKGQIDIYDTPTKSTRFLDVANADSDIDHLLPEGTEENAVIEKAFFDHEDDRPTKRLKFADELDLEEPSFSARTTSAKSKVIFGTQDPRVFATQAKRSTVNAFVYAVTPPNTSELLSALESYGLPNKIYQDPYYSKAGDAPERPWEFAGLVYRLKKGDGLSVLEEWKSDSLVDSSAKIAPVEDRNVFQDRFDKTGVGGWEYAGAPPGVKEARRWLERDAKSRMSKKPQARSQIDGVTQAGPYGFKDTPPVKNALEVFAPSRGSLVPDPGADPLAAVFYSFQDSDTDLSSGDFRRGVILTENPLLDSRSLRDVASQVVKTELDLLNAVIDLVLNLDPDVVTGWEVQNSSWGYLSARGAQFDMDVGELISRATGRSFSKGNDQWGLRKTSTFKVSGRHVLNVWRIMRTELNLGTYTLENTAFHLLRQRVPKYAPSTLTEWHRSLVPAHRARLLHYLLGHTVLVLRMLDAADIIAKTAEFARVFGVDFFSVISRGSQFKVESFMFRIAKPESFVLRSPNKHEVGRQNAAECMPLIMEPLSAFYNSPLVVLDFQSLYPSVMVAYNYCYSTCLGRVTPFRGQYKFGVAETSLPPGLLESLQDHITVAPNGIMYVKTEGNGQASQKRAHGDKTLSRILDARQLGLKYIANVTYGYTSASFSGRMPAVEIADSIVQSGRETLEKAIKLIETTERWGARVVYGDTDSIFVYLSGKTKEQAFRVGYDIADAVTRMNPVPVKLKFEKVYLPCVLMAKKRYVGFKYESPDDIEPVFDAKGIETVRRDGVPAQQKMTETALKILFRTQNLSDVKSYCYKSWIKILENKASIQDFIFAREIRMGTYSDKVPPPPGVAVAARQQLEDANNEIQYGDRMPYVIARGAPQDRLVDRAAPPEELFDGEKQLDGSYYISRVLIPPLERIFNLLGADVRGWYEEMPRKIRADSVDPSLTSPEKRPKDMTPGRLKIEEHFRNSQCILCRAFGEEGLCGRCRATPAETICGLLSQIRVAERRLKEVHEVCRTCTQSEPSEPVRCVSLDCSWLFQRKKVELQAEDVGLLHDLISQLDLDDRPGGNPELAINGGPNSGLLQGHGDGSDKEVYWISDDTEDGL